MMGYLTALRGMGEFAEGKGKGKGKGQTDEGKSTEEVEGKGQTGEGKGTKEIEGKGQTDEGKGTEEIEGHTGSARAFVDEFRRQVSMNFDSYGTYTPI